MRSIKLIISGTLLVLLTCSTGAAKGWRGLVPLHSTRQDVERLLGNPTDFYYALKNETVYVDFSKGSCQGDQSDSYKVPANVVTRIMVIPKSEPLLDSLEVDTSKYKKKVDGDIKEHVFYYNEEAGECIEVFEDKVESITYIPVASESSLRCYASIEDWMTANNVACVLRSTKFDQFGTLTLGEEHLRLKHIAIQLKSDSPIMRAWIIVYRVKQAGRAAAVRRAKRIKHFLVKEQGLSSGRVLTVAGPTINELRVEVWISFVGQSLPEFSYLALEK